MTHYGTYDPESVTPVASNESPNWPLANSYSERSHKVRRYVLKSCAMITLDALLAVLILISPPLHSNYDTLRLVATAMSLTMVMARAFTQQSDLNHVMRLEPAHPGWLVCLGVVIIITYTGIVTAEMAVVGYALCPCGFYIEWFLTTSI